MAVFVVIIVIVVVVAVFSPLEPNDSLPDPVRKLTTE
jgi:hypothetical protein